MSNQLNQKERGFWGNLWAQMKSVGKGIGRWVVRYPLALIASVVVISVATLLMFAGKGKNFNWGGILSQLFGREADESRVEVANEVPENRDEKKEEPDKHGFKQKQVHKLPETNNPFRDKSKVTVREDGKKKKIQLPEGVEDKDVDKVYRTDPETYKVTVKGRPEKKNLTSLSDALK